MEQSRALPTLWYRDVEPEKRKVRRVCPQSRHLYIEYAINRPNVRPQATNNSKRAVQDTTYRGPVHTPPSHCPLRSIEAVFVIKKYSPFGVVDVLTLPAYQLDVGDDL